MGKAFDSGTDPATAVGPSVYSLVDRILPHCACPLLVAHHALRAVARRFCLDTLRWRETYTATTEADETEYTPAIPEDTTIEHLAEALLDGSSVAAVLGVDDTVELSSAPAAGQTLEITVALCPLDTGHHLPAWLLNRFGDVLVDGALSALFKQPTMPWASPEWQERERAYLMGAGRAKQEVFFGRSNVEPRIQIPQV